MSEARPRASIETMIEKIEYEIKVHQKALEILKGYVIGPTVSEESPVTEPVRPKRPKKKTEPKSKRPGKKKFHASRADIKKCLEAIGMPATPFTIRNKLLEESGISVTEEKVKEQLMKAEGKLFWQVNQGLWELKTEDSAG